MHQLSEAVVALGGGIEAAGFAGVLALTLAFMFGSLVFLPRPALSALAGLAYGWAGLPIALIGATCGAALAFWIGRRFARQIVLRHTELRPKLKVASLAIEQEGWRAVLLLRLGPLVPSSLLGYLIGTTNIRFVPYLLATAAGIFPGVIAQVGAGSIGRTALTLQPQSWGLWLLAMGVAACTLALVLIGRRARRLLQVASSTPQSRSDPV